VAKFCAIAHGAKRIAKANQAIDLFLERHVTSNPAAHAFSDEEKARCWFFPIHASQFSIHERLQRCPMRCDQLRQWVGPFPLRAHVIVVESFDLTDFGQTPFPILHPRMRRRRTRPWGKKN
jgi:hypothetical protein